MIVEGHSHSECAFNDSLIDGLANVSQSGEPYFYTYFKTKKIIEQNPQIDKVFIEFSNNQIDKMMDEWIWGKDNMAYRFPKYAVFMDYKDLYLLFMKNPVCFKQNINLFFKSTIKKIFKGLNYNPIIGGYRNLVKSKTDSLVSKLNSSLSYSSFSQISEKNIEYLSNTICFCEKKNIKVFLVRSPLHEKYQYLKNELLFQKILKEKFASIEFLDFLKFPLSNSEFGDLEHLNNKGARIFSSWFDALLKNGLLEKVDKQKFIDNEIKILINNNINDSLNLN